MINGYDDFEVGDNNDDGDNVNDDVLIRGRYNSQWLVLALVNSSRLKHSLFVGQSHLPTSDPHLRSMRLYFQCICIAMFPCICIWFLLYLCYIILYLLIRTFLLPMLFLILPLKILPLQSWTSPGKDEEQSFVSLLFIFASPPLYHSPDKHGHNVEGLTQTNPSLFWEIFPNAEDRPWLLTEFLKTSSHIKKTAICMMSMRK